MFVGSETKNGPGDGEEIVERVVSMRRLVAGFEAGDGRICFRERL
jgi:hypothetical protein